MALIPSVSVNTSGAGTATPVATLAINPSGSNRVLIVSVHWNGSATLDSVQFDGNAMTLIRKTSVSATYHVATYYYINPATGSANVRVEFSTTVQVAVTANCIQDADQTDPIGAEVGETGNSNSTASTDITTESDDSLLFSGITKYDPGNSDMTMGASQTELADLRTASAVRATASEKDAASAGSQTMSYTWSYVIATDWAHNVVEIKKVLTVVTDTRAAEAHGSLDSNSERPAETTGTPAPVLTVAQVDDFTIGLTWTYNPNP